MSKLRIFNVILYGKVIFKLYSFATESHIHCVLGICKGDNLGLFINYYNSGEYIKAGFN